ncbi:hypothetical protein K437DRAFT_45070 [Tilletiaria anomala UBC 951]|uniref:Transmembrane protein n=1 Tax=Tilletiaria anomala (strain ATCC 24038 / CBS 436.72 / UBC 951) TaxID=1037660 RepID=A0A066WDI6_TILAU|nr:uncharacterized protein K437DRAFT_45070 [Tilletiaria anomala UBC 951]KDN51992.1 hypothetical protein K437DRAFT_45070 [Tilletiaria anomala UBC 951]
MAYSGPDTGNITINGLSPASWALEIFLPPLVPSILGQAVAIFVCYWEFVVLFPSEVQIWRRLMRRPFHWQFAPSMTLFMRYTLLCYASAAAFTQYSTTMTDSACTGASTVFVISVICLNTSSVICMAWRSHAVAMGVIERPKIRWAVRACVGFMLLLFLLLLLMPLASGCRPQQLCWCGTPSSTRNSTAPGHHEQRMASVLASLHTRSTRRMSLPVQFSGTTSCPSSSTRHACSPSASRSRNWREDHPGSRN